MKLDRDKISRIETRESRTVDGVYSETHLTRWCGTLTGHQVAGIIQAYLADQLCPHKHGLISSFSPLETEIAFELVYDHDWFLKDKAADAVAD